MEFSLQSCFNRFVEHLRSIRETYLHPVAMCSLNACLSYSGLYHYVFNNFKTGMTMPIEIFELVIKAAVKNPLKERGKSDKETHRVVIERSTHDPTSAHVQQILDRLKVKKRQLVQI